MSRLSGALVFFGFSMIVFLPATMAEDAGTFEVEKHEHHWHWLQKLSPKEAIKVRAAYELARKDETERAARQNRDQSDKAYHDALYAGMLRADPSIKSILQKPSRRKRRRLW